MILPAAAHDTVLGLCCMSRSLEIICWVEKTFPSFGAFTSTFMYQGHGISISGTSTGPNYVLHVGYYILGYCLAVIRATFLWLDNTSNLECWREAFL